MVAQTRKSLLTFIGITVATVAVAFLPSLIVLPSIGN